MCLSVEIEAVFTETEISKEWNVNLLQNSLFRILYTYSLEFFIGRNTSVSSVLIFEIEL